MDENNRSTGPAVTQKVIQILYQNYKLMVVPQNIEASVT